MRIECVARLGFVQVVDQTCFRGDGCDSGVHLLRLFAGDTIFVGQPLRQVSVRLLRCAGIKLKRSPYNRNGIAVIEVRQGVLEVSLADVAPGADDVRPDFDDHENSVRSD